MKRVTILNLIAYLLEKLADVRVEGANFVPETGGFIVVTNHLSRLDTPFLMLSTPRRDVIGMVAKEYQRVPFFRWILDRIEVIWVSRDNYDFSAFRTAADYLKRGWIVGMAPEGTRSKTGALQPGKPGAALLAIKSGAPIVPASVMGSAEMLSRFVRLRKMRVTIQFGEPFHLKAFERGSEKERLTAATDEIMCRIAALLPEQMRGVYTDHPRLQELLADDVTNQE